MKCRNSKLHSITLCILFSFVMGDVSADCESEWEPGTSFACAIDWDRFTKTEAALLIPIDDKNWIGWIYSTAYFMKDIALTVEQNDCEALELVGKYGDSRFLLRIGHLSPRVDGYVIHDDPKLSDRGTGWCRIISDDNYDLEVRRKLAD